MARALMLSVLNDYIGPSPSLSQIASLCPSHPDWLDHAVLGIGYRAAPSPAAGVMPDLDAMLIGYRAQHASHLHTAATTAPAARGGGGHLAAHEANYFGRRARRQQPRPPLPPRTLQDSDNHDRSDCRDNDTTKDDQDFSLLRSLLEAADPTVTLQPPLARATRVRVFVARIKMELSAAPEHALHAYYTAASMTSSSSVDGEQHMLLRDSLHKADQCLRDSTFNDVALAYVAYSLKLLVLLTPASHPEREVRFGCTATAQVGAMVRWAAEEGGYVLRWSGPVAHLRRERATRALRNLPPASRVTLAHLKQACQDGLLPPAPAGRQTKASLMAALRDAAYNVSVAFSLTRGGQP